MQYTYCVTGAGGFIGGHLCKRLREEGHWVRGVDIKYPDFRPWTELCDEFIKVDMRHYGSVTNAFKGIDRVFALAADMGGMGFISHNDARILYNNLLINMTSLEVAKQMGIQRYVFTSSVCAYPEYQMMTEGKVPKLTEAQAYPAQPQDAYGWEKLTTENLILTYRQDYGFNGRIVRLNNTYGPYGTWDGGREKAPAALCRKIAVEKLKGNNPVNIEVWGDGQTTRTFMYVDDCVEGILRMMEHDIDFPGPVNLGVDEVVTIEELAQAIANVAGVGLEITYVDGPMGVRNRDTDNSLAHNKLWWTPENTLVMGLHETYPWIEGQVSATMQV